MKGILSKIPLFWMVIFLTSVPILLSIVLFIEDMAELLEDKADSLRDKEVVEFALRADELAHNLAVERGLTAGVIGSKGAGAQIEQLKVQRKIVDDKISLLREFKPQYLDNAFIQSLNQTIYEELETLPVVRQQVDSLKLELSPFDYYSNINHLLIDNAKSLVASISKVDIATLGVSLMAVVDMKEKTGQIRGALNGAFARKNSSPRQYQSILSYIDDFRYAYRKLELTLPVKFRQDLSNLQNAPAWKEVDTIQTSYLNQDQTLDQLKGPSPTEWFPIATDKIKLINGLRLNIQKNIIKASDEAAQSASNLIFLFLLISGAITLLLIIILILCAGSLRRRVNNLTNNIRLSAETHDLTKDFSAVGKDELATISNSIYTLNHKVRDILLNAKNANDHSEARLASIIHSATSMENSSQRTISKCENIATAMTELSQSSSEIAVSAERALEETNQMRDKVTSCQDQSQNAFKVVEGLVTQIDQTQDCMQELEKDALSISKIVDTITGISEQTNLLALNAAIEAARAGEHGRGFAVVSTEVRDLAQRSKSATEHISELLNNMSKNTTIASESMEKSKSATQDTFQSVSTVNTSISDLEHVIDFVNEHITTIANSTTEQSKASEEVNIDVDVLVEIAHETDRIANELSDIVKEYQNEAKDVKRNLSIFKI
ncbi:methyl-accepting chemotaxis protein [Vibrio viridaestus]|uniref:Chemotaxis protein n=1 Tax=Vibrio viridaestus TaxID=2487322 RepID=A0A3N9TKE1_9VIBR|nr:methyl-accepting chemotaxis protein [Vibrio viridaestus]RQW64858.1 chemotaxis protein [Vibrio viridaestus]